MKKRKSNRLKGYDYSKNNLYFVTNCVKNNLCCLGRVVCVGTGRDLSVHNSEIHNSEIHNSEIHNSEIHNSEIHNSEIHNSEIHNSEIHNLEIHNSEIDYIVELNQYGLIVDKKINWLMSQYEYVAIHNYVIMPNHFHLILEIDSNLLKNKISKDDSEGTALELSVPKIKSLSSLMGALKTTSSNEIHKAGFEDFAWHRSFHDHIIRDEKSYQYISNYIDLNPQKWNEDRFNYKS